MEKQRWAVVLAAGSGTRLEKMTGRDDGSTVPKQYCSMYGGPSLLRLALTRAFAAVPHDRVLCVVAAEHEHWWQRELGELPSENVIVQPRNRGTAVGTLLPLLVTQSRDCLSRLMFLPADHYAEDEHVLVSGIGSAFHAMESHSDRVILLGMEPEEPETELGYILAGRTRENHVRSVRRFVEKPTIRSARSLVGRGAFWNSFVFGAQANTLLKLFRECIPETVEALQSLGPDLLADSRSLRSVYESLESIDLSRSVFTGSETELAVLRVPPCGWTDLGTPERVAKCLSDCVSPMSASRPRYPRRPTHVDLASACSSAFIPLGH